MHNDLRYQVKTHAISAMPRKEKNKIPASSRPIFFLLLKTCYKGE
jgi:hypothetical protein